MNVPKSRSRSSNLLWCNELYLRCLYYTAYHLVLGAGNALLKRPQDRKIYVNALIEILKVTADEDTVNIEMNEELEAKLQRIYSEYFVDKYFDHWYNKAPVSGLDGFDMRAVMW